MASDDTQFLALQAEALPRPSPRLDERKLLEQGTDRCTLPEDFARSLCASRIQLLTGGARTRPETRTTDRRTLPFCLFSGERSVGWFEGCPRAQSMVVGNEGGRKDDRCLVHRCCLLTWPLVSVCSGRTTSFEPGVRGYTGAFYASLR